jgi:hypothetical protein
MIELDRKDVPPILAELLRSLPLAPLGPGRPDPAVRGRLEAAETAFASGADRDMVTACRAGLWLAFDFLDESHRFSQDLHTPEGSYWHGLMHRREPDFANAAYWFRRVGDHPVFEPLRQAAARQAADGPAEAAFLTTQTTWDPFAFIDLCEAAYDERSPAHEVCRQVQRIEWEWLFAHCFRRAVTACRG